MTPWLLLALYLGLVNLFTAAVWGYDKQCAVRGEWRISEATLLALCSIGGWPLGLAAAEIFRHKTRKPGFIVKVGVVIATQVALVCAAIVLI